MNRPVVLVQGGFRNPYKNDCYHEKHPREQTSHGKIQQTHQSLMDNLKM